MGQSYAWCAAIGLTAVSNFTASAEIKGTVVDILGKPLPYVRIRISGADASRFTTTVFSVQDGTFDACDANTGTVEAQLEPFRIGWKEVSHQIAEQGVTTPSKSSCDPEVNVADQVPASAWLEEILDSNAYQMTMVQCSNCHQLGADRMKKLSMKLRARTSTNGRKLGCIGRSRT